MILVKQSTRQLETSGCVTIGSGAAAGFFVKDAVMAAVHFEVQESQPGVFVVRDLGTVTGTYIKGQAVTEQRLADGDEIIAGVSGTRVKIKGEGDQAQLTLQVRLNSFAYEKPKEGVFGNDPDRWVQSEQRLGRFPLLRVGNRSALLLGLGLLVAVVLSSVVFEYLSDAGPLTASHALLLQDELGAEVPDLDRFGRCHVLAQEQSCEVCHTDGGTPQSKCLQCHEDLVNDRRHPFGKGSSQLSAVHEMVPDQGFCVLCHTDHQSGKFVKDSATDYPGNCQSCHGGDEVRERYEPPAPELAGHPYSTIAFPHAKHSDVTCAVCHEPSPGSRELASSGLDDPTAEDFAEVPYETCAQCHGADEPGPDIEAQWIANAPKWTVRWHGSEDGEETCGQCHPAVGGADNAGRDDGANIVGYGPGLQMVKRSRASSVVANQPASRALYEVERRSHGELFEQHSRGEDCTKCHRANENLGVVAEPVAVFWHALHLSPDALENQDSAECRECHASLDRASDLIVAPKWWRAESASELENCSECHYESEGDGKRSTGLLPVTTGIVPRDVEPVPDFPHSFHVDVEGGCFACHTIAARSEFPFGVMQTDSAKAACSSCHAQHDNVGGGACKECHPARTIDGKPVRDVYWTGQLAEAVAALAELRRPWPQPNGFSHWSPGHLEPVDQDCQTCHRPEFFDQRTDDPASAFAAALGQVKAPAIDNESCRDCHLEQQFHWR